MNASQDKSSSVKTGLWFSSLRQHNCMFAQRRVAFTANLGGGSAQFDDATDEIDEDLEDRDDTSDIIDSGDETDEVDLANEDRRADVGNGAGAFGFHW